MIFLRKVILHPHGSHPGSPLSGSRLTPSCGDTLVYDRTALWRYIGGTVGGNRKITNPDLIFPGQVPGLPPTNRAKTGRSDRFDLYGDAWRYALQVSLQRLGAPSRRSVAPQLLQHQRSESDPKPAICSVARCPWLIHARCILLPPPMPPRPLSTTGRMVTPSASANSAGGESHTLPTMEKQETLPSVAGTSAAARALLPGSFCLRQSPGAVGRLPLSPPPP